MKIGNMHIGAVLAMVVGACMLVMGLANCALHTLAQGQSIVAFLACAAQDVNVSAGAAALGLVGAHSANAARIQ